MKKLIFASAVFAIGTAFCALPPAKPDDPNVVKTNGVEYTRRGSMSTKNYTVTDVDTDNMMKRGYNNIGVEEIDGEESKWDDIPSDIWKAAETTNVSGRIKVKFPVKTNDGGQLIVDGQKVYVNNAMHASDNGLEYLTAGASTEDEDFIYLSSGKGGYMTNGSYCWGTNRNDKTAVDKFELPKGGRGETIQNKNLIFCDRAWVTNFIIKAGIKTEAEVKAILNNM